MNILCLGKLSVIAAVLNGLAINPFMCQTLDKYQWIGRLRLKLKWRRWSHTCALIIYSLSTRTFLIIAIPHERQLYALMSQCLCRQAWPKTGACRIIEVRFQQKLLTMYIKVSALWIMDRVLRKVESTIIQQWTPENEGQPEKNCTWAENKRQKYSKIELVVATVAVLFLKIYWL